MKKLTTDTKQKQSLSQSVTSIIVEMARLKNTTSQSVLDSIEGLFGYSLKVGILISTLLVLYYLALEDITSREVTSELIIPLVILSGLLLTLQSNIPNAQLLQTTFYYVVLPAMFVYLCNLLYIIKTSQSGIAFIDIICYILITLTIVSAGANKEKYIATLVIIELFNGFYHHLKHSSSPFILGLFCAYTMSILVY